MLILYISLLLLVLQQKVFNNGNSLYNHDVSSRIKEIGVEKKIKQDSYYLSRNDREELLQSTQDQDYFTIQDLKESKESQYIHDMKKTILSDYANEKICFTQLFGNYSFNLPSIKYKAARCIILLYFLYSNHRLFISLSKRTEDQVFRYKTLLILSRSICFSS